MMLDQDKRSKSLKDKVEICLIRFEFYHPRTDDDNPRRYIICNTFQIRYLF